MSGNKAAQFFWSVLSAAGIVLIGLFLIRGLMNADPSRTALINPLGLDWPSARNFLGLAGIGLGMAIATQFILAVAEALYWKRLLFFICLTLGYSAIIADEMVQGLTAENPLLSEGQMWFIVFRGLVSGAVLIAIALLVAGIIGVALSDEDHDTMGETPRPERAAR